MHCKKYIRTFWFLFLLCISLFLSINFFSLLSSTHHSDPHPCSYFFSYFLVSFLAVSFQTPFFHILSYPVLSLSISPSTSPPVPHILLPLSYWNSLVAMDPEDHFRSLGWYWDTGTSVHWAEQCVVAPLATLQIACWKEMGHQWMKVIVQYQK